MTSWQALENTVMGDKTVIEQQGYRKYIHSGAGISCANVHNCRGNGRDIGTYYSGQVLWWLRQRNGSLIVVGRGVGGQITVILQTTDSASVWARESPSECILSSLTTFVVFLLSTARIIRLKHDSIGKLNLNFVFKVPLIMQN